MGNLDAGYGKDAGRYDVTYRDLQPNERDGRRHTLGAWERAGKVVITADTISIGCTDITRAEAEDLMKRMRSKRKKRKV